MSGASKNWILGGLLMLSLQVAAGDGPWKGKSAAVVLSYDDALNVHLDHVIPALNRRQMKGTFYLALNAAGFRQRMPEWQRAAGQGHELGNHTLFHPCQGSKANRDWVSGDYDLDKYSKRRILDELNLASAVLQNLDGQSRRTFAYPCGEFSAGGQSFMEDIKPLFAGARGVLTGYSSPRDMQLYNINAHSAAGTDGAELVSWASQAIESQRLVVYLFHGVGSGHALNVSLEAHRELLDFLQRKREDIWLGTMLEVVDLVREIR